MVDFYAHEEVLKVVLVLARSPNPFSSLELRSNGAFRTPLKNSVVDLEPRLIVSFERECWWRVHQKKQEGSLWRVLFVCGFLAVANDTEKAFSSLRQVPCTFCTLRCGEHALVKLYSLRRDGGEDSIDSVRLTMMSAR
ncbi:uncharacterized protein G2W53_033495 [Senna tora]|uniref:Uncharacterized protein n=1 Tax=Senna tora TaxID=362788 RepID=A0A834T9P0_9FABA|nr:uncharacterized protein G2W53_033495 [Senna tora]